jgi:hypothetical protein
MNMQKQLQKPGLGMSVGIFLLFAPLTVNGDEAFDKQCARVVTVERKVVCGDNSLLVVVQNICGHAIQISVCVQKADGAWDCGLDRNVQPEQKVGRWVCEGIGEYKHLGCSRDAPECSARPG